MKAVILAAGYGNRMRPLTDNRHKTLLKIGDRTILERIIDGLLANGVDDITIVTGYRRDELTSFLAERYPHLSFGFIHNARYRETNNIFSLALAFNQMDLDADVMLIESDLICDPVVFQRAVRSRHANVALVDRFRSGMDGTVVTVDNGVITNVIPPHLQGPNFDFSDKYKTLNIYKFSQEFCASAFKKLLTYYANVIDDNCYYELILGILIYMQRETVHAEILDGERWAEVDDPNDLSVAEFIFDERIRRPILERSHGGFWNYEITDFCYIRNMYFPPDAMISEMRNNLPALIRNYGSAQPLLNHKAAYFLLCSEERVNILNGASQVYPGLGARLAGKRILLPRPTFGEYPRVFPEHDRYDDAVGVDEQEIEKRCQRCDVAVIVNPNNPTGTLLKTGWIYQLVKQLPNKLFIVDESFIDFSTERSLIELLEEDPLQNVLVIKSLSKVLGIPGLRLGFTYSCNGELNREIRESIPIWNLNTMAEYVLETILKHRNALKRSFAETIRAREEFREALAASDLIERVYPSGGNFLLISIKPEDLEGVDLVDRLLSAHSTFIHNASHKFPDGKLYYRLAVRHRHENLRLAALLTREKILGEEHLRPLG